MPKFLSYRLPLVLFVMALGITTSLGSNSSLAQEVVRVGGTGGGTLILLRMVELYKQSAPEARVEAIFPPLGTSGGLNSMVAGTIQIAIIARPPPAEKFADYVLVPWLKTPFVLVARDAPDGTSLSQAQVADIYNGRLLLWPNGKPIRLVMRAEGDADITILSGISPALADAVRVAWKRPGLPVAETDVDNQQMLEKTPESFGIMTLAQLKLMNAGLKTMAMDGVEPSIQNLLRGSYPYARKFYLLVRKNQTDETRKFLEFLRSPLAIEQISRYGLAPLAP